MDHEDTDSNSGDKELEDGNDDGDTSSSDEDDTAIDAPGMSENVENEQQIEVGVMNDILEGDATEICRQEPIVDDVDTGEPTGRKRRMMDDDDEDFFEDFIDDDKAYENVDETQVWLDAYNADLNLKIYPDNRLMAEPLCEEGFAYMIAGVRASYGVNRGRVGFEVKILENLDISQVQPEETHFPHELRVGWSTDTASLQLGESHYGYGFCSSTGKKVTQWRFSSYAEPYGEIGDVIACLVDFEKKSIEFVKNGQAVGVAFTLGEEWESTVASGPPLFPHIASKNIRFEVNFGQSETPWFGLPDGYIFINNVPLIDRIRGPIPPASKSDCKVLMMVGLPGCGKTKWVENFCQQHQEQLWHVLSAPTVLEQMKVQGISRKKLTQSRWDVMMGATVKCLNKLMTLACRKKKNYIIDQTNCYPLARKKKITAFKDFHRVAVVIVPTAENHADRLQRQGMMEGKQMPPEAMLEMKACFTLPKEEDDLFDEIQFVELGREEAQRLVEHYNEEGKAFKPPEPKRRRGGDWIQQENQSSTNARQDPASSSASGFGHSGQDVATRDLAVLQQESGNQAAPTVNAQGAAGPHETPAVDREPIHQAVTPSSDHQAYHQSYHHAYRYMATPRTGWPSNWPQAQWQPQSALDSSPGLNGSSSPDFPIPMSTHSGQSSNQTFFPADRRNPDEPVLPQSEERPTETSNQVH